MQALCGRRNRDLGKGLNGQMASLRFSAGLLAIAQPLYHIQSLRHTCLI